MKNFSMFHSFVLALATWVLIGQVPARADNLKREPG